MASITPICAAPRMRASSAAPPPTPAVAPEKVLNIQVCLRF